MEIRLSINVYPEACQFVINTNIFADFYENYLIVNIWNIYETNVFVFVFSLDKCRSVRYHGKIVVKKQVFLTKYAP